MSAGYDIKRIFEAKTFKITLNVAVVVCLILLVLSGAWGIFRFFFPKKDKMVNNPRVYTMPFSKVEKIDQTSTQIQLSEKPWEVGLGGGGLRYDNKDGYFAGGWVKRKW